MLNFCAHFLSRRTNDAIVTIFTDLAKKDLFLCEVLKIAFTLQQCWKLE